MTKRRRRDSELEAWKAAKDKEDLADTVAEMRQEAALVRQRALTDDERRRFMAAKPEIRE